ncbi:uncharacterized protein LOC130671638 [Microplitis mediator]|uniref:uncharacterized protein LOC130671638 n=1 Tax=Microplitis mediator TaxID=375433 RepID=UPI0025529C2E|nr:uncharacterized protein LOC130671638 [Microplitis mediator]
MKWCMVILFFISSTWASNSIDSWNSPPNCASLKAQQDFDLDKIMGKWYVVEILEHKPIPEQEIGSKLVIDRCPIIRLRFDERGLIRLLWSEEKGQLEYTFSLPNSKISGVWNSAAKQNGSLIGKTYTQFEGSVLVMKAVAQHVLLTFCSENIDYQLYSILMGRQHILEKSSITGIHNLLKRRTLHISSTRSTCAKGRGSAVSPANAFKTTLILYILFTVSSFISNPERH